jgi:hypothetical protein
VLCGGLGALLEALGCRISRRLWLRRSGQGGKRSIQGHTSTATLHATPTATLHATRPSTTNATRMRASSGVGGWAVSFCQAPKRLSSGPANCLGPLHARRLVARHQTGCKQFHVNMSTPSFKTDHARLWMPMTSTGGPNRGCNAACTWPPACRAGHAAHSAIAPGSHWRSGMAIAISK